MHNIQQQNVSSKEKLLLEISSTIMSAKTLFMSLRTNTLKRSRQIIPLTIDIHFIIITKSTLIIIPLTTST